MTIAIKKSNEKIQRTTIESFEAVIGHVLPDDYRAFLLTSNGGKPEANIFTFMDRKNSSGVNTFFGLLDGSRPNDLEYENRLMVGRIPQAMLIIAAAEGGNFVCLSLRSDTFGQVFFWDYELEEEGPAASFSNLFLIDASFQKFFEHLNFFDQNQVELRPGQVKKAWIDPDFLRSTNK